MEFMLIVRGCSARCHRMASLLTLGMLASASPAADLASQVREAVQELQVESEGTSYAPHLELASVALDLEALWPALEHATDAFVARAQEGYTQSLAAKTPADATPDLEGLRRDLGQRAGELLDLIQDRRARGVRPAIVAGWIDVALARQKAYRDTGIGFANAATDDYLIASLGQLEKAAFLLQFEYADPGAWPEVPGLNAAIDTTESQILGRYTSNTVDDRYPPAVVANASIDFSRKLIAADAPLAATLRYLDAASRLYDLIHESDEAVGAADLTRDAKNFQNRIASIDGDSSIPGFLVQKALEDLAADPSEEASRPHSIAEVMLRCSLPAYFTLLDAPGPDDSLADNRAPVSTVTVLRYPYT